MLNIEREGNFVVEIDLNPFFEKDNIIFKIYKEKEKIFYLLKPVILIESDKPIESFKYQYLFNLRLSKFITLCGISSRRKSEDLIRSGIVKVNNVVIFEPQFKVLPEIDIVTVYDNMVNQINSKIYIALNKPVKYLSLIHI